MDYSRYHTTQDTALQLYESMLLPRMIEEKMLILLRQGKISKWFSGIGQEAIAVGCTAALASDEMIFPMHRNLGVFTSRHIPLHRLFAQWQGKPSGFTKGRDRSFHFGSKEHHIAGMISHLGPQLSLASGVALAHKLDKQHKVSLAFTGEGGTSEGEFHEALNVAAVWQLPVIFVVENNGYALSTPISEQYRCTQIADRAKGYGIKSKVIDGNNILEVYETVRKVAKKMRKSPEPYLIECMTFRRRGHEEASGTKYVPKELMSEWEQKDPVERYEQYLLDQKWLTTESIQDIRSRIKDQILSELQIANEAAELDIDSQREIVDVYKHHEPDVQPAGDGTRSMRFIDAISDGLHQAMQRHDDLVLMGQDIADYGGVFKITDGFLEQYGHSRVRNTPLCESAIVGIAVGLSMMDKKSMVEMQFADFVSCGFNQIVNNCAKLHYRWGQHVDTVIRMPTGGSVGAGPFHSQSTEAWFAHTPGLKIVYPSTPADAKGLLLAAFNDPNPVMYYEHKAMYRNISGDTPDGYYTIPIGKARLVSEGSALSVITYGLGVHWATALKERYDYDIEILDLRSLQPLDYDAIAHTVRRTNRVILLHEDCLYGGIGAEISAYISEHLFEHLDAPVVRLASMDTPVPFHPKLEAQFLPEGRLRATVEKLMSY